MENETYSGEPEIPQETPEGEVSDEILSLLQGTVEGDSAHSDGEAEPEGKPATTTLTKLAEQHGLDPEQLYKSVVSLPDEQGTATLEELKNAYTAHSKQQGQSAALAEEKTAFANEKLSTLQTLESLISQIPEQHRTQDLIKAHQSARSEYQAQQEKLLHTVIPEWSDTSVKESDAKQMVALAQSYGPTTQAALMAIGDAGLMKMVYDYTKIRERMDAIKGKQRKVKAKGAKATSNVSTAGSDRNNKVRSLADRGDRVGAIAELLAGGS